MSAKRQNTFKATEKAFSPTFIDLGSSSSRLSHMRTSPSLPQVTRDLKRLNDGFKILMRLLNSHQNRVNEVFLRYYSLSLIIKADISESL